MPVDNPGEHDPALDDAGSTDLFSYDPFTRHGFYQRVNQALIEQTVDLLPTGHAQTVVDLGCGTGAVTEQVLAALRQRGIAATVIGVEPSAVSLSRARARLADAGPDVRWLQGNADDLAGLLPGGADALFFCNAIHLVPDKADTLRKIGGVLVPGGLVAINSTFFAGAYVPGTERFYRLWTVRALRWLKEERPDVRPRRTEKTQAMQWISDAEYAALLQAHSFEVVLAARQQAEMTLQSFQDIGRYGLFIQGALPGVPFAEGAEALYVGARQAFDALELTGVPRNWLQLIARNTRGQ